VTALGIRWDPGASADDGRAQIETCALYGDDGRALELPPEPPEELDAAQVRRAIRSQTFRPFRCQGRRP
jgi:hypothetical protein